MEINKKFFDPNYPLLSRFREIAPGTYDHCQNVVNIVEAVAIDLELNIDLIKCAAMYHDIGKTVNPLYFSENQSKDSNIHDNLDPFISYNMISRHIGDGVIILLNEKDLPRQVIEIISQHHGNTVIKAFYDKTSNEPADNYRYKCSKPKTSEALILMIADQVEATASANKKEDIDIIVKKAIENTTNRLSIDGQLDNMKIGELNLDKQAITKKIKAMYHKRVTYTNINENIDVPETIVEEKIEK